LAGARWFVLDNGELALGEVTDVEGAGEAERFVLGFAVLGELVDDCPFEE
jgi:hypothetical protein